MTSAVEILPPIKGFGASYFYPLDDNEPSECIEYREASYEETMNRIRQTSTDIMATANRTCIGQITNFLSKGKHTGRDKFSTAIVLTGSHPSTLWWQFMKTRLGQHVPFVANIQSNENARTMLIDIIAQLESVEQLRQWQYNWILKNVEATSRLGASANLRSCSMPQENAPTDFELLVQKSLADSKFQRYSSNELFSIFERTLSQQFERTSKDAELAVLLRAYEDKQLSTFYAIADDKEKIEFIQYLDALGKQMALCFEVHSTLNRIALQCQIRITEDQLASCRNDYPLFEEFQCKLNELERDLEMLKGTNDHGDIRVVPIIVHDFDCCDMKAFSSFVILISDLLQGANRLEIQFILAISSSNSPAYLALPSSMSRYLNMRTFSLTLTRSYVEAIFIQIVTSRVLPFVIPSELWKWIYGKFVVSNDLPLELVLQCLQAVALTHFSKNPFSFLCMSSVRCTVNELDGSLSRTIYPLELLENSIVEWNFNGEVVEIRKLYWRHNLCVMIWKCIEDSLKPSMSTIAVLALLWEGTLINSSELNLIKENLKLLSPKELQTILMTWKCAIGWAMMPNEVSGLSFRNEEESRMYTREIENLGEKIQEILYLFEGASEVEILTMLSPLRDNVIEVLMEIVGLVHPVEEYETHEIFFYRNLGNIKENSILNQSSSIGNQILQPLVDKTRCKKLKQPYLSDMAVAYQIYRNEPEVININSWFQQFVNMIDKKQSRKSDGRQKNDTITLKTRFVRCVSIMEYLGFVSSLDRKSRTQIKRMIFF